MRNLLRVTSHVGCIFFGCGFVFLLCYKYPSRTTRTLNPSPRYPVGNELLVKIVQFSLANVPEHVGCHRNFISYDDCIHLEFTVCFFPCTIWFIVFHITVLKCQWPGVKQALYLLTVFLNTQQSCHLEILTVFLWKLPFSSCKEN